MGALSIEDLKGAARESAGSAGYPAAARAALKTMLHIPILTELDKSGALDCLTFQGGSCLSEAYGAPRLSDDLDFAAGAGLDLHVLSGIGKTIEKALGNFVDAPIRVKPPNIDRAMKSDLPVARWVAALDLSPDNPSVPNERIKVEVAAVPSRDPTVVLPKPALALDGNGFRDIVLPAKSMSELLCDKTISLAYSGHPRPRDAWDMTWLLNHGANVDRAIGMLSDKLDDYGYVPQPGLFRGACEKAASALSGAEAEQIAAQLPTPIAGSTLFKARWVVAATAELAKVFRAAEELSREAGGEVEAVPEHGQIPVEERVSVQGDELLDR